MGMVETDIYKDILQYRISSQMRYNEDLIAVRNPEVRQLFAQLRDDETRAVVKLQQRLDRLEASPGIISRIFPTRARF
jgi:rubrerythrin